MNANENYIRRKTEILRGGRFTVFNFLTGWISSALNLFTCLREFFVWIRNLVIACIEPYIEKLSIIHQINFLFNLKVKANIWPFRSRIILEIYCSEMEQNLLFFRKSFGKLSFTRLNRLKIKEREKCSQKIYYMDGVLMKSFEFLLIKYKYHNCW